MEVAAEKKKFSIRDRIRSVTHAARGIGLLVRTSHNMWGHIVIACLAIYLGIILNISNVEWVLLVLTIGFVFASEAFNTAMEIDINLTSPEYHPYARDTKDVSAGAVFISVIVSIVTALFIFLPKIIYYVKI